MQTIKNIIFDLGGIFLNLDYPATEKAFIEMGVTNFQELFAQSHANDLFEQLETGKIQPEAFYQSFRETTGLQVSDEQIRDAWNAMLLDFPADRLQWLDAIRNKYNVYLYSNTNKIHYDFFSDVFRKAAGSNQSFDDYFIKAHYSHELGLRKPYPASFTALLQLHGLEADETVFIDDTLKNIEGAKAAGLQTIHLVHPETVLNLDL
ncbi:HAD family hydrolase [Deminuibacter soli]|uniref:HAD family phosphatase n=1 Tax=Deminuibacter soli TaxID=2291815 RepID=A0A3E1NQ00_9BACT|nr:HAD family phosphatase [Deminuibacter soli]RFM30002.1 HAD family phosphatase [Deminuibacter soli]